MGYRVVIREVGLRDGLQTLPPGVLSTDEKVHLLGELADAGLRRIEAGSFVSRRAVPQMADSDEVFARAPRPSGVELEALVVDRRGAGRALEARAGKLVVVVAASDSFSMANVRMSTEMAIAEAEAINRLAAPAGVLVVADVATAFGCAFEGPVPYERVLQVVERLGEAGITETTLADTTGMAAPPEVTDLVRALQSRFGSAAHLGLHFHNTRGLGLANVWAGLAAGVTLFDGSLGGLGGCPFSPGATGNVATEDLVHLLRITGYETGINLDRLIDTGRRLGETTGLTLPGQVLHAGPRWRTKESSGCPR